MKEYITLTVDGKSVRIEKGSTLLEAAIQTAERSA